MDTRFVWPALGAGVPMLRFPAAEATEFWCDLECLEDPDERGYDAIRRLFLLGMAKVAKRLPENVQ
jgi:hypothetical protein